MLAVKALFLLLFLFGIAVVVGHHMKADAPRPLDKSAPLVYGSSF